MHSKSLKTTKTPSPENEPSEYSRANDMQEAKRRKPKEPKPKPKLSPLAIHSKHPRAETLLNLWKHELCSNIVFLLCVCVCVTKEEVLWQKAPLTNTLNYP